MRHNSENDSCMQNHTWLSVKQYLGMEEWNPPQSPYARCILEVVFTGIGLSLEAINLASSHGSSLMTGTSDSQHLLLIHMLHTRHVSRYNGT